MLEEERADLARALAGVRGVVDHRRRGQVRLAACASRAERGHRRGAQEPDAVGEPARGTGGRQQPNPHRLGEQVEPLVSPVQGAEDPPLDVHCARNSRFASRHSAMSKSSCVSTSTESS